MNKFMELFEEYPVLVPITLYGAVFGVMLAFSTGMWCANSYFEARSYSRLTGKQVSTWDAMWLDLRVQESVKD